VTRSDPPSTPEEGRRSQADGAAEGEARPTEPGGEQPRSEAESDGEPRTETEVVRAGGHEHVRAQHDSTVEVTTDDWLTPAGDCIVGVDADRAPADFDDAFVAACREPAATITATLVVEAEGERHEATVRGSGHPELTFDSERGAVARTSDYVDDRTVLVDGDAAAADLDRDLVAALADAGPAAELTLRLRVDPA